MNLQYSINCNYTAHDIKGYADSPKSSISSYVSDSFESTFSEDFEVDAMSSDHSTSTMTRSNNFENRDCSQNKKKPKKQYNCTYCQKVFSRPSALQTHTYTHTAEKPFKCTSPNCGRYFSVVSNLRRHFKVHQKTQCSNKLSPEDRLRCVKQLMLRGNTILEDMNKKTFGDNGDQYCNTPYQPNEVPLQKTTKYCHNYPILPALTSSAFQNQYDSSLPYSYLPSPPLRLNPTFKNQPTPGRADQNSLSANSLFAMSRSWPMQFDETADPYFTSIENPPLVDTILKNSTQSNTASPFLNYNLSGQMSQNGVRVSSDKGDDYKFFDERRISNYY